MPTSPNLLRSVRLFHLYCGVFIAPALLFFAFTGTVQTFSLHETTRGSSYKPPAILVTLAQLHKKQTIVVPQRRPDTPKPPSPAPDAEKHHKSDAPPATPTPPPAPAKTPRPYPMKIFFLIVALGLFSSTCTGLYMSYKYAGNKKAITATLIAGIVIPILLLFV
jgi:hypothetical protein